MSYLATLNEKQTEAVKHTEGYLRVIAGAGSGKTKLLVSRYAYLVKDYGINSSNILCVTFTNKAAGEMKRRIRAVIGGEYDTSLICTYHGFCVRVLREDVEKIFYPKEFQIIDTSQQKAILGEIYQKFELKLDHASFEKIIKLIGIRKADRRYVANMCSRDNCQILDVITGLDDQIIEEYLQRQKQIYAMDFDDLMYFTLDIFSRCPEVLEKWQDRLNYIQVDEFQDSSSTEMELIDKLSAKHKNLMIVGDPDQNIYEWRGSDVRLLVDFDVHHTPTDTVYLNQNYRSTSKILQCANTLIEKNKYRLKKDLFTLRQGGEDVYHYHMKNEYDEAEKICELITRRRRETDGNLSDFAVLYRSGFLSRIIEKKFTENGIPYEIFGGVKFYHRMEIQDLMAYLRLVAFDDDIAFKRIVNTPRRKFGRVKLQYLMLQQKDASLFETLKADIDNPVYKGSGAREFVETVDKIRAEIPACSLYETVEKVCSMTGYERYLRELGDMERFENLAEFKRIAAEYERSYGEQVSLKEFINQLALQSEDDGEEQADTVKLMTIHAAKGLEFPCVFIVGFSEGVFPSSKTLEDRKEMGLEEERRLCYVAITRAERELYLMDSEGYTQNGKQKLPSRFLKEIGEGNYVRIGTVSKELQDAADLVVSSGDAPEGKDKLEVGDEVEHHAFGRGVITGYGKNLNSYKIKFDKLSSEREISADYFAEVSTPTPPLPPIPPTTPTPPLPPIPPTTPTPPLPPIPPEHPDTSKQENLWERDDVPKDGWSCTGITDLGAPVGVCEMCGHQIIRYVHHMSHPAFRSLGVGCVCAGKMEGDIDGAQRREADFKNREKRRENFLLREWKVSKNRNFYLKIGDHLLVLYYNPNNKTWKYAVDGQFCRELYKSREEAVNAVFEAFEKVR